MISRYVVLGTLILLAVLIVLSAAVVFGKDAVKGWRDKRRGPERPRKDR